VSLDREQEGERRKRGSRHSSPSSEEVPSGRSRASVTRLSFPKPSASRRTTIFQHRSRPLRPSASSLAILEAVPPEAVAVAGVPMSSKMALFPAQVRPRPPPSNPARPRFTHPSQPSRPAKATRPPNNILAPSPLRPVTPSRRTVSKPGAFLAQATRFPRPPHKDSLWPGAARGKQLAVERVGLRSSWTFRAASRWSSRREEEGWGSGRWLRVRARCLI
jgi:hypothetical protein